jgi:hypothetical protein
MAKASIELPNGTTVVVEGTTEEIHRLLEFYGSPVTTPKAHERPDKKKPARRKKGAAVSPSKGGTDVATVDLAQIINLVKNCDEAEDIEAKVLDRTSQVNRILLPLYIVHEHLDNAYGLTSGEISKVTTNLGIPVQTPNVSNTLSGTASRYVIADQIRRRGQAVRYKLSRRGAKYLSSVIKGTEDGE